MLIFTKSSPRSPYTQNGLNWHDQTTRATVEQKQLHDGRVDIIDDLPSTSDYDNIIIAAPIWWGIPPRLIATTIDHLDLNNKVLAPFATSGGSNFDRSQSNIERLIRENGYQNVDVKRGIVLHHNCDVDSWLANSDLR